MTFIQLQNQANSTLARKSCQIENGKLLALNSPEEFIKLFKDNHQLPGKQISLVCLK